MRPNTLYRRSQPPDAEATRRAKILRRHWEARVLEFVFPTDTNHMGAIFGGTLVTSMDKTAAFAAIRRGRNLVVTASIDSINFAKPPVRNVSVQAQVEQALLIEVYLGYPL